jgi:hypothetical protein
VPAGATNVTFTIAAASGGGSKSPSDGSLWNHSRGGFGRAGNFTIAPRSGSYNLTFYIGGQGGNGVGPQNPGGSGGSSPLAGGGNGHRSGGGGGGATAVYDSWLGRYTAWVGGGGGAGRFGQDTGISGYYTAGRGIGGGATSGSPSWRTGQSAPAGHRGGGGGGSTSGGAGSLGGAQTSNGYGGIGGNSGWYNNGDIGWITNSGYGNFGNGYAVLSYVNPPPSIDTFTASPSTLVLGNTFQLNWSVSGTVNSVNITDVGNVNTSGSATILPGGDITYTITATGPGGTVAKSVAIDVHIPPQISFSVDKSQIVGGDTATLTWSVTGDADTMSINPGIGGTNLSGTQLIQPSQDTTYTAVASGLGGTDTEQLTVEVVYPPEVSLTGPLSTDYGDDITLTFNADNAVTSLQLLRKYVSQGNPEPNWTLVENLPTGQNTSGNLLFSPDYDDFGPDVVQFQLYAVGEAGLNDTATFDAFINVDRTPDAIDIPASEDKLLDEQPVITPDAEVTSQQILIDDIDVPVEIKADQPIQVEIDDSGTFQDIREI